MTITYVSTARIPDEWAHVTQIMKTCEAFARAGHTVELVVPKRARTKDIDPFVQSNVEKIFSIRYVPTLDLMAYGLPYAFTLMTYSFFTSVRTYIKTLSPETVLYARGDVILPLAGTFGRTHSVIWESHERPNNIALYKRIVPKLKGIITVTKGYSEELVEEWGMAEEKVVTAPDAVDLADFENPESKDMSRRRLGMNMNTKVIMYIGLLDAWKGVDTLYKAGEMLAPDIETFIIGGFGTEKEAALKHPTLHFLGYRPYTELADNQQAADILILPNSGKAAVSTKYTSPLKLFTYMASGVPIIASDIPSLREILSEENAYLVPPDDADALAATVRYVFAHPEEAQKRALKAKEEVQKYTWDARVSTIASLIARVTK